MLVTILHIYTTLLLHCCTFNQVKQQQMVVGDDVYKCCIYFSLIHWTVDVKSYF